jgi:hypothetical protein
MTTIRISRLPEIKNDRVSADDYLIINDGDIVTSKVTFKEFVYAIGAQDIEFTGDMVYSGDVVFEGDVTGDFYNKDQTYTKAEIDQIVRNLNDYNILQDARISALVDLTGRPPLSKDLGIFPGNVIPDNATIVEAFESVESMLMDHELRISQNEVDIIEIRQDIVDINAHLGSIDIIIDGINGPTPPDTPTPPDSGIINQLNWLIAKVEDHEARIVALELVVGSTDISAIGDGTLTGIIADHDVRIIDLEKRSDINDAENAALITLSGVGTGSPAVHGTPIVSNNLETFTYPVVPHTVYNEAVASPAMDGKTVKAALQLQLDAVRTRAPIQSPVFTEQTLSGQKYGITGPRVAPSMIPMYHPDVTNLRAYKHAQDDTTASCEGAFAYTRNNTGYTGGGGSNSAATQGRAWFRNQTDWVELLAAKNRGSVWEALGLVVAANDADATANGVLSGFIYVQKQNITDPDEQGLLKVNGLNTASNPRP